MTDDDYIATWLNKAEQDLKIIAQGMDRPEDDWVTDILCFHSQQAIEKVLKAFLIKWDINPPRTHSIEMLLEKCRQTDRSFPDYEVRNISYFAVEARYPDESYQPDAEETKWYVSLARRIICEVKMRIF